MSILDNVYKIFSFMFCLEFSRRFLDDVDNNNGEERCFLFYKLKNSEFFGSICFKEGLVIYL